MCQLLADSNGNGRAVVVDAVHLPVCLSLT